MVTLFRVLAVPIKPCHLGYPDIYFFLGTRMMEGILRVYVSPQVGQPSLAKTPSSKPQPTPIIIPSAEDDNDLLHPKPRPSILSRRDIVKIGHSTWEPGPLIRLLPDAVHIKTVPERGIDIDPRARPPPPIPIRIPLSLASQMRLVGAIRTTGTNHFWYEGTSTSTSTRKWHPGIPIFIRVLLVQPCQFIIAYADDTEIDLEPKNETSIEWFTDHTSLELRQKAAEKLHTKVLREIEVIDEVFREAARWYRVQRREWEIRIVKHEFFTRENCELFRKGTTGELVRRTVRMGRKDIVDEGDLEG